MKHLLKLALQRNPSLLRGVVSGLLRVDNRLYALISNLATLAEGEHPKHRLTTYHDFFVDNVMQGEITLDVGCGRGELLGLLANKSGVRTIGVERDPIHAADARRRVHNQPNVEIMECDIWNISSRENVDVIALSNVLEHLSRRPELLGRLVKLFNPKRILVRVPLFDRDWLVPYKKELGVEYRLDDTHEIEYTEDVFDREVREAGLKIEHMFVQWGEIYARLTGNRCESGSIF